MQRINCRIEKRKQEKPVNCEDKKTDTQTIHTTKYVSSSPEYSLEHTFCHGETKMIIENKEMMGIEKKLIFVSNDARLEFMTFDRSLTPLAKNESFFSFGRRWNVSFKARCVC
jgi:hypothetical protein